MAVYTGQLEPQQQDSPDTLLAKAAQMAYNAFPDAVPVDDSLEPMQQDNTRTLLYKLARTLYLAYP